jgi:hypothetical protein
VLVVAGFFSKAGGVPTNNIAKWDGTRWMALGHGVGQRVKSLAIFDSGSGPELYVGGQFADHILRWNGSFWRPLGSGVSDVVETMIVHDDGSGPALFVGGSFQVAGGLVVHRVAKWNGTSWSSLDQGMNQTVRAFAIHDDGSGPALYAGGVFTRANDLYVANHVARWNGVNWTQVGGGTNDAVHALTVFDDGGGPKLIAGGIFTTAGGSPAARVAAWNGSSWTALGGGLASDVDALVVHAGSLFAGGAFGTSSHSGVARWNGSSWNLLGGSGLNNVSTMLSHDDGKGARLFVGGDFSGYVDGKLVLNSLARRDGSAWTPVGTGFNNSVSALVLHDDGGGTALYAGGSFTHHERTELNFAAKWDGTSWSPLASGLSSAVGDLVSFDDGAGPALYASTGVPGSLLWRLHKWDGASFGLTGDFNREILDLEVFDDGAGLALFVAGAFTTVNGMTVNHIARWDGLSWTPLGTGTNWEVFALAAFDDGSGPALFAAGHFITAGGGAASHVAKWDGVSWSALGSGCDDDVYELAVADDGSGPALFAGGVFTTAGGVAASCVAKWDGSSWSALDSGLASVSGPQVVALVAHDDGQGPALFAGGSFTSAGGVPASNLAKWDGSSWSPLGGGADGLFPSQIPQALISWPHAGPALLVGGTFIEVDDASIPDAYLAKWGFADDQEPPALHVPRQVSVEDLPASAPGEFVSFSVTASDCPTPSVVCTPPSGSFFPRGTTLVTCTATDAAGNQLTRRFPVIVASKRH